MTAPTLRRWSTADVAPGQRLAYWVDAVCDGFLEMSVEASASAGFDAMLESAPLDNLSVNRVRGSRQDVYRTRQAIARSSENFYYLLCKNDLPWAAGQQGSSGRLLPGDLILVDSRRRYEFHFPYSSDTVSIELPTAWVESWLPTPAAHTGRRLDGGHGWGQALSAFVRQLTPELALAPPLPPRLITDQLGALLALATGGAGPMPPDAPAPVPRQRIVQAIEARHAEPGLTAAHIAADLNLSERTLHRHLAAHGNTFARTLLDCRIARARRMLLDPRFDRLTVAEIGHRVGWSDSSHFVRQCRRALGATPGTLRRRR